MTGAVVDTHAMLWYLTGDAALSNTARSTIESADSNLATMYVSAISLVEVVYLAEKGRISMDCYEVLEQTLRQPDSAWQVLPIDKRVVDCMRDIPRDLVPDMPDRIIAATAKSVALPLISCDKRIRNVHGLNVVW
jgi:PIN domain nuclease of toxin-antitoxin system